MRRAKNPGYAQKVCIGGTPASTKLGRVHIPIQAKIRLEWPPALNTDRGVIVAIRRLYSLTRMSVPVCRNRLFARNQDSVETGFLRMPKSQGGCEDQPLAKYHPGIGMTSVTVSLNEAWPSLWHEVLGRLLQRDSAWERRLQLRVE